MVKALQELEFTFHTHDKTGKPAEMHVRITEPTSYLDRTASALWRESKVEARQVIRTGEEVVLGIKGFSGKFRRFEGALTETEQGVKGWVREEIRFPIQKAAERLLETLGPKEKFPIRLK